MTTTAGHSFYIGPVGFFYDQVNDTGSWEPLVIMYICKTYYLHFCMKCKGYYFVGVCAQRGYKRHIDSPSTMSGLRYFSRQVS